MSVVLGVFAAAFLAATILPFSSEVVVSAAILSGSSALAVWLAASVGNTLGAVANGILGAALTTKAARRWLGVGESQYERATRWYGKWGVWSLLLAWMPVVGDALTVVAGALHVRWWFFVTLVFIGKSGRYALLIFVLERVSPQGGG